MTNPCCDHEVPGHVPDCWLVKIVSDRDGYRYKTRLGDSRNRSVTCRLCGATGVWSLPGTCDTCATREAVYSLVHPESVA